jgi:hypothetical protein
LKNVDLPTLGLPIRPISIIYYEGSCPTLMSLTSFRVHK